MKFIAKYFAAFYIVKFILYTLLPHFYFPFKSLLIAVIAYLITHFIFHRVPATTHHYHKQTKKHNPSFNFKGKDLSNVKKAKPVK